MHDSDRSLVFIQGNHRSGTTILYNALVESGGFRHPTPFHLAHFRDYLTDEGFDQRTALTRMESRFERLAIRDRFIDGIAAHPLSPEEYGFALPGGRIRPNNLERFDRFCRFVRSNGNDGCLLLKNPRDFPNTRFIQQTFPNAKFIFLHRHPGPVIESRIRELRLLYSQYSPYQAVVEPQYDMIWNRRVLREAIALGLRPGGLLTLSMLIALYTRVSRFLRDVESLAAGSHFSTTYERLCAEPDVVVGSILEFLGVEPGDLSPLRDLVRPTPRQTARSPVLRSAAAARLLRPYLDHCGYDGLWPD